MVKKAHTEQEQTSRLSQFFLYARQYRPENSGHRDREAGVKETKRQPLQPSFPIHHQEGHNDCRFTGMIQLRHDPARPVTLFTLTELSFNVFPGNLLGKFDPAVIATQLVFNHKLKSFKRKLFFVMSAH
jgi:hypothetical protein